MKIPKLERIVFDYTGNRLFDSVDKHLIKYLPSFVWNPAKTYKENFVWVSVQNHVHDIVFDSMRKSVLDSVWGSVYNSAKANYKSRK